MNLLQFKISKFILALITFIFVTACAATPEKGTGNLNTAEYETAPSVEDNKLEQTIHNPIVPKPPKDYAALIPNSQKNPKNLIHLNPGQLIKILGPPSFRRTDTPAEIWQYRYRRCILNLFLYENEKGRLLKVKHYSMRLPNISSVIKSTCLLDILIDRQKKLDGVVG